MRIAPGANPDTCQHHLVQVAITMQLDLFVVCVSCASTIDNEFKDEFSWDYDIDHNVWKRCRKRKFEFDDRFNGFDRDMLQTWGRDQGITPVPKPRRGAN